MKKKLLVLDLALAATVVILAAQVRDRWFEARKREQVVLGRKPEPVPAPPFAPLPPVTPVRSADYAAVVEKNLFSADRNPVVIVKVVPPKPMPDLPVFYGVMDLGEGPMAIMAAKANQPPREIHYGGKVGEFTLVSAGREQIVLEWDGKKIEKLTSELAPKEAAPAAESRVAASSSARTPSSRPAPAPEVSNVRPEDPMSGKDLGSGFRACVRGDTTPFGTVRDGLKKVSVPMPFGSTCRWEPAK